jgi:hypothetical protein
VEQIILNVDALNGGEFFIVEGIVDYGDHFEKSVPFSVHKSIRKEKFTDEKHFLAYLGRMARAVIARCGDARNPFPQELVEGAQS